MTRQLPLTRPYAPASRPEPLPEALAAGAGADGVGACQFPDGRFVGRAVITAARRTPGSAPAIDADARTREEV